MKNDLLKQLRSNVRRVRIGRPGAGGRRGVGRRRGSILIFVVGILVLLALMGTAYVAAVRLDRVQVSQIGGAAAGSSAWMTPPAQQLNLAEQLVLRDPDDGLLTQLLQDVFTGDVSNPASNPRYRIITADLNFDVLGNGTNDQWLASRTTNPTVATPQWPFISRNVLPGLTGFSTPFSSSGTYTYGNYQTMVPDSVVIQYPGTKVDPVALSGKTRVYPAFNIGGTRVLAADADGDGIADSGLIDLSNGGAIPAYTFQQIHPQFGGPPVYTPGPTATSPAPNNRIYAAYRVVDNNAALNLNTAYSLLDTTLAGAAQPNYGWFRSNVGLHQLMTHKTGTLGFENATNGFGVWRRADASRAGYAPTTVAEGLEMAIGRVMQRGSSAATFIDESETAALVYHGGMIDPSRTNLLSETRLPYDLLFSAANYANDSAKIFRNFPADESLAWHLATFYTGAFNGTLYPGLQSGARQYGPEGNYDPTRDADLPAYAGKSGANPIMPNPKRMHVVTSNPLSNYMPAVYNAGGALNAGMTGYMTGGAPKKVGINTAEFADLWAGFWNVMADPGTPTQAEDTTLLGSSVTLNNGTVINDAQTILELRSAIAAVNAEDMRDTDDEITARDITIGTGSGAYRVTVYGSERQPFFKSADYSVAGNTMSVTLENPYTGVTLPANFTFMLQSHTNGALTAIPTLTPIGGLAPGQTTFVLNAFTLPGAFDLVIIAAPPAGTTEPVVVDSIDLTTIVTTPGSEELHYEREADWAVGYNDSEFEAGGSAASGEEFPVAIHNTPTNTTQYPFGGFPRVGDVMLVPYAGSYLVRNTGGTIIDRVAATRDVTFVGLDDMNGRLVPDNSGHFAARIFDVFSVTANPNDDRERNIAKFNNTNTNALTANDDDGKTPVHGFVNINTAPLEVLQTLPMIGDTGTGAIQIANNNAAATNILTARGTTPIESLMDLTGVTGFSPAENSAADAVPATGFFLTGTSATTAAPFRELNNINRLSNYATTRSDSFTVYVLIQAWQDATTTTPVLVAERRQAFIVDRSQLHQFKITVDDLVITNVNAD